MTSMKRKALYIAVLTASLALGGQQLLHAESGDDAVNRKRAKFSETDTYLDLGTGKSFQLIYDGLNDLYNRSDLFALDLYVNTRTRDTFWLEDAILVNNALLPD